MESVKRCGIRWGVREGRGENVEVVDFRVFKVYLFKVRGMF